MPRSLLSAFIRVKTNGLQPHSILKKPKVFRIFKVAEIFSPICRIGFLTFFDQWLRGTSCVVGQREFSACLRHKISILGVALGFSMVQQPFSISEQLHTTAMHQPSSNVSHDTQQNTSITEFPAMARLHKLLPEEIYASKAELVHILKLE